MGRPKSVNPSRPQPLPLAPEQYSELNATLYDTDPAAYLRFRLHTLVLIKNEQPSAKEIEVTYGSLTMPRHFDFTAEERARALAMESCMLVQHAGESLMRLFLAHAANGPCPWLDVTKLRFPEVNAALAEMAKTDYAWPSGQVARIFLGGVDPQDAGVDIGSADWQSTLGAHSELLRRISARVLARAPLYNAVKHGLVGAPTERLGMSLAGPDGQQIPIVDGPAVTYLHGKGTETSPWQATTDHVQIESDFAIVQAVAIAISNLWAVARRKYLAAPGQLQLLLSEHVDVAFLAATVLTGNQITGVTTPLRVKVDPHAAWGKGLDLPQIELQAVRVSDETLAEVQAASRNPSAIRTVDLPPRPTDRSPFTGRPQYLFPFSPPYSSST